MIKIDTIITFMDKKFLKDNGLKTNEVLRECKGFACPGKNEIFINLSAMQWKPFLDDEDFLINIMSKTLTHETIHILIGTKDYNNPDGYTIDGEERVCALMANQINFRNKP